MFFRIFLDNAEVTHLLIESFSEDSQTDYPFGLKLNSIFDCLFEVVGILINGEVYDLYPGFIVFPYLLIDAVEITHDDYIACISILSTVEIVGRPIA
jgi:hypothetical protein